MERTKRRIYQILHDPSKTGMLFEDALKEIERDIILEIDILRDELDPICFKCGARKSEVDANRRSIKDEIKCIPMDSKRMWLGYERHQFRTTPYTKMAMRESNE